MFYTFIQVGPYFYIVLITLMGITLVIIYKMALFEKYFVIVYSLIQKYFYICTSELTSFF